ncbi:MAG TPA: hypothetical protein VG347_23175 [Verrucomicrobiae bacterium]|nr:hypothetical protein [Verrucomicrobiae bacterium]
MNQIVLEVPDQILIPATPRPVSVHKTTRAQWKGLWHVFRGMRQLLGEKEALNMIERHCRRDALLILQVIL